MLEKCPGALLSTELSSGPSPVPLLLSLLLPPLLNQRVARKLMERSGMILEDAQRTSD